MKYFKIWTRQKGILERCFEDKNTNDPWFYKPLSLQGRKEKKKSTSSKCNLRQDFDRKAWIENEMYNHTLHAYLYACHDINAYRQLFSNIYIYIQGVLTDVTDMYTYISIAISVF